MTAPTALDLMRLFERAGIEVWVDGGWGVDALLGEQTRPHADLDVVLPVADVQRVRQLLSDAGFAVLRDWLPTALAMRHPDGREVDLHPVTPTADGGGDQELFSPDPPFHDGPPATGHLDGVEVACVSAESQLRAHQGYEPQPEDRADVLALATRFGLPLPEGYGSSADDHGLGRGQATAFCGVLEDGSTGLHLDGAADRPPALG